MSLAVRHFSHEAEKRLSINNADGFKNSGIFAIFQMEQTVDPVELRMKRNKREEEEEEAYPYNAR